jgi:hypothetical protein
MTAEASASQPTSIEPVPLQDHYLTPGSTRSLQPLPTAEEPPKTDDPVLLKEQEAMGMLDAGGSTRQRTMTMPKGYGVRSDDDEDDLSYRDPKDDQSCFTCIVL